MFDIKSFSKQCLRVWHLLKRPGKEEYLTVAKISALGIGIIGLLGFAISLVMQFVPI